MDKNPEGARDVPLIRLCCVIQLMHEFHLSPDGFTSQLS